MTALDATSAPQSGTNGALLQRMKEYENTVRSALPADDAGLVLKALDKVREYTAVSMDSVLSVVEMLHEQHADAVLIAAVLLGPAMRSGLMDEREIENQFGRSVTLVVSETCNATVCRTDTAAHQYSDSADLLRSIATDVRVAIARIALRLVELEHAPVNEPTSALLAQEARSLMIPLADRLGLGRLRGKLEDACFRQLEPTTYESLRSRVSPIQTGDDICLGLVRRRVAAILTENGVDAIVTQRAKSLWSLHRKMSRLCLPLERIMDRLGLRVVARSVPECYRILGLLHTHFRPIASTFKDYIGLPKDNGYQSLHTCVYPIRDISAKPVEFQIRTRAMHAEAEFGVAAHWRYKSAIEAQDELQRQSQWFRVLSQQHDASLDYEEFVEQLNRLVYEHSLVVFLRGGRQVRLPAGSTVRDVVKQCALRPDLVEVVRVNAQCCDQDACLRDGDTVEWDENEAPVWVGYGRE